MRLPVGFLASCLVEASQRVNEVLEALLFLESELSLEVAALQAAVPTEVRPGLAGRWVRVGCARLIHVNSSDLLAGSRGAPTPAGPFMLCLYPTLPARGLQVDFS